VVDAPTVARLDALLPERFDGEAFRHHDPSRNSLSGAGARTFGGRWNPPESFPVLYTGLTAEVVEAEFARMASLQGRRVGDFLPRTFVRYRVALSKVLDLRSAESREVVRLSDSDIWGDDRVRCQVIGEAAHYLAFEAILAPSATAVGDTLSVFMDRIGGESSVEVVERTTWTLS
jgi:RES domain-containing protein